MRRFVPRMFIMLCWHKTARRPHLHFYRIYPCFRFQKQIVTITTSNFSTPNHLRSNFFLLKIELDYPFMAMLRLSNGAVHIIQTDWARSECILMALSNLGTWHFHFNSLHQIFGLSLMLEMSDGHPWRKFFGAFFIFIAFFFLQFHQT